MTEKSYVVPCSFKKVVNIHLHAANCNVDDALMYQTSYAFQRDLNILFQWSVDIINMTISISLLKGAPLN